MTDQPDLEKVMEKIAALLQLASKNTSEAEAASAAAKAQELMTRFNLDMAVVERRKPGSGKREDAYQRGGMYLYQRELWRAVAKLNFCLYWPHQHYLKKERTFRGLDGSRESRTVVGFEWQHRVVGRTINVVATRTTAQYLEQVIERLTRERLGERSQSQFFSRWAVSYREGVSESVVSRLYDKRRQMRSEERRRQEAEAAASTAGLSTATSLTISRYADEETDANIDFLWGEGTAAEWAAERAAAAAREKAEEEAYVAWAAAHPEEAAAQEKKRRSERRRSGGRPPREREKDWGAFKAGSEAGRRVSLDPQTEDQRAAGRIGHG